MFLGETAPILPTSATVIGPGGDALAKGAEGLANLAVAKAGLLAASVSIGMNLHPLAGIALFWLGTKTPAQPGG